VNDFLKLYIVLIVIPIAAIMVPAVLTWTRDLDATARRMRKIDEETKKINFWNNWVKIAIETIPDENEWDTRTETTIRSLVRVARRELAYSGTNALRIYRLAEQRELEKFKLYFKEFQEFRAGLSWFRRAFLLYKAPNSRAKTFKTTFHLMLITLISSPVLIPLIIVFRHFFPSSPVSNAPWYLLAIGAFTRAHPIMFQLFFCAYLFGVPIYMRQQARRCENDRSFYIRDWVREA
jgi:hypothetical protein